MENNSTNNTAQPRTETRITKKKKKSSVCPLVDCATSCRSRVHALQEGHLPRHNGLQTGLSLVASLYSSGIGWEGTGALFRHAIKMFINPDIRSALTDPSPSRDEGSVVVRNWEGLDGVRVYWW